MKPGKVLGIDYGSRRVGIALSDETRSVVFPREAMEGGDTAVLLEELALLCGAEGVTAVVLGLPMHADGSDSLQAGVVQAFGKKLSARLGAIPVAYVDERFTTAQAGSRFAMSGLRAKSRKRMEDSVAAQILVETYLQRGGR